MNDNRITKHHILAKSRFGGNDCIVMLQWGKHEAWHRLFGNRTITEIIKVLRRLQRLKGEKYILARKEERCIGLRGFVQKDIE
jgi:hypothetical protein